MHTHLRLFLLALILAAPAASQARAPQILVIGDSLSVGPFGTTLQDMLVTRYGTKAVTFYASCGSSPEHWLAGEPVFVTRCGYRVRTASRSTVLDYENGRRPPAVSTPKIENILASCRPEVVIVQLGTNWMDDYVPRISDEEIGKKLAILKRFAAALRGRKVIWILPPDTTKFSRSIESAVRDLIRKGTKSYPIDFIDSAGMTRYVVGRTGSDGVHYNGDDARSWARQVVQQIIRKVPADASPRVHLN